MQKIDLNIESSSKIYSIYIGQNVLVEKLKQHLQNYSKIVVLTDSNVSQLHLNSLIEITDTKIDSIIIHPGEEFKNLQTVEKIWQEMVKSKMDRKSLLICFGGGVIGDLGGFCASTFMRGLDFIQIPTTLLSQVDSSVGGKTGFDFFDTKNLIGTFAQPKAVFCDTEFFKTLPEKVYLEGFGEVIKYGVIWDPKFLDYLESLAMQKGFDPLNLQHTVLEKIIARSLEIKAEIVAKDELEKNGYRQLLNFGHTYGHALEMLVMEQRGYLYHGEAIAIGMLKELELNPENQKVVPLERLQKIISAYGLPTRYEFKNLAESEIHEKLKEYMLRDKKNSSGKIKFVSLN